MSKKSKNYRLPLIPPNKYHRKKKGSGSYDRNTEKKKMSFYIKNLY